MTRLALASIAAAALFVSSALVPPASAAEEAAKAPATKDAPAKDAAAKDAPAKTSAPAQQTPAAGSAPPAQAPPIPPAGPPVTVGSKESASWTDTTIKSATSPANKVVLEGAQPATVVGELVEVSCYLQLGKKGPAHIPCGSDCIRNGQPAGILDADGKLTILFVEEHDPRRYGQIDVREKLALLVARQVTATGMLTKTKEGYQALYVKGSDFAAVK